MDVIWMRYGCNVDVFNMDIIWDAMGEGDTMGYNH
jgi:hypothetical protein